MFLFRLALGAALVAALASIPSCSGKSTRSTGGGGGGGGDKNSADVDAGSKPPSPVRRVLQLSLEHVTLDVDAEPPTARVSLIFTDETGATRRDVIGEYPGGCSDVSATARAEPMKPILGLDCTAGARGVRLRFVHRKNQLYVVIGEVHGGAEPEYQPLKTIDLPEGTPVRTDYDR